VTWDNRTRGTVLRANYHGTYRRLHIATAGPELTVDISVAGGGQVPADTVMLGWHRDDTHVLVQ
jgi:hypothetical protein